MLCFKYSLAGPNTLYPKAASHAVPCTHVPVQPPPVFLLSPHHSSPSLKNPTFIFYCGEADPTNHAPLQPCGGESFPPDPFLSLWSGQFTVLLEFTRSSHLHCVPEFTQPVDNGEREYQWHNCSRLRRQRGSWKTVSTGGRRGGGCAASLILHHKHQSTLCLQNAAEKQCWFNSTKPGIFGDIWSLDSAAVPDYVCP